MFLDASDDDRVSKDEWLSAEVRFHKVLGLKSDDPDEVCPLPSVTGPVIFYTFPLI
jgi:hypothetical protein